MTARRLLVLGAAGGLGRNAIAAGVEAGHRVSAFVRGAHGFAAPAGVQVLTGDASSFVEVARAMASHDVALFCVNPPFSAWQQQFPALLRTSMEAARATGARLVFPANVWIYGHGDPAKPVDETCLPDPISEHGRLRAAMERELAGSASTSPGARRPTWC